MEASKSANSIDQPECESNIFNSKDLEIVGVEAFPIGNDFEAELDDGEWFSFFIFPELRT